MKRKRAPLLVAIVGGSGAGKSWLADQLEALIQQRVTRMSLDDFYLDRSHLPPGRRAGINYDHPRSIDWPMLDKALHDWLAGRKTRIPRYDFINHARLNKTRLLQPGPMLLVDGLWLLHRPKIRRLFDAAIFIECTAKTRLTRRLARDRAARGRTAESVRRQFSGTVQPMHKKFVEPQVWLSDMTVASPLNAHDVQRAALTLAQVLDRRLSATAS